MDNKINQKNFSYGFELEGIFTSELQEKLRKIVRDKNLDIDWKTDGSVNSYGLINTYRIENPGNLAKDDNGNTASEVNIGIFKSADDLFDVLQVFENNKNYFSDNSCGLHLHLKPVASKAYLKGVMFDNKFINKLQTFARLEMCPEIRTERLTNHYCAPVLSFTKKLQYYKRKTKYAFMGNHPQGTTEFRFLSTCEHKSENVRKFVDYFLQEINQIKPKSKRITLAEDIEINADNSVFIEQGNKKVSENIAIDNNKIKKIILCV
jgi:hypothetical protein